MTLGNRLKFLMEERNISQKELSKELNIAISTLNGYANDYREPDYKTLIGLAQYFDVSVDYLLGVSNISKVCLAKNENSEQLQQLIHFYEQLDCEYQNILVGLAKVLVKNMK